MANSLCIGGNRKSQLVLMSGVLFLVLGCATSGTNFSWEAVDQIKPGMTTAEVRGLLGEPTVVTKTNNDKGELIEMWVWSYAKVGFMGSSTESKAVSISFENGVVAGSPTTTETSH